MKGLGHLPPIGALAVRLALVLLGGCATVRSLSSDVSSFSHWPTERRPTTYAFERLPSQEAQADQQQRLEAAARPAIEAAGFSPGPDPAQADVLVTLGARIMPTARLPYADPFWWGPAYHGPYPYGATARAFWGPGWYYGWGPSWYYGWGPGWYHGYDYAYQREVGVLIRDRQSGQPLYEARASSEGYVPMAETALPAMFRAAMKDFPTGSPDPHPVTIELHPPAS